MSRLTDVPLTTLVKLGSLAVHIEEFLSPFGHEFDRTAIEQLLLDPDVKAWLKMMDEAAMLPKKRNFVKTQPVNDPTMHELYDVWKGK